MPDPDYIQGYSEDCEFGGNYDTGYHDPHGHLSTQAVKTFNPAIKPLTQPLKRQNTKRSNIMITGEMIISYPAVFEPKPNPSGALKYSCSLLVDKGDTKTIEQLQAAIDKAIAKGKEKVWDGKLPKFRYEPLRDGDEELASGDKTDPVYKNKLFLNCSSDNKPGVVGPDAKPLMDQTKLYAGCIVRADINPFPYNNSGNKGIGWGLNNLMLVRDGDRLDGRQNAEDAFSDFAKAEEDDLA